MNLETLLANPDLLGAGEPAALRADGHNLECNLRIGRMF